MKTARQDVIFLLDNLQWSEKEFYRRTRCDAEKCDPVKVRRYLQHRVEIRDHLALTRGRYIDHDFLRGIRKRYRLTQSDAATLAGVTTMTWLHWETGKTVCRKSYIAKIDNMMDRLFSYEPPRYAAKPRFAKSYKRNLKK